MAEKFSVRIEKERLVFSAAHFITFDGDTCEPLHGHNYHVRAELIGELDENHYVVDFIFLRDALKQIVDLLDHKMLLPKKHATIKISEIGSEVEVRHAKRRWVFPKQDCVILPLANTTAELLARYVGGELLSLLKLQQNYQPESLKISVDECDGQWGEWCLSISEPT